MKLKNVYTGCLTGWLMAWLGACTPQPPQLLTDREPDIFPDYKGITVPCNIAPLNFAVEGATGLRADFSVQDEVLFSAEGTDEIDIPARDWQQALQRCTGGQMEVTVSVWNDTYPNGIRYAPFTVRVAGDSIDAWIAYRLIPPGYRQWKNMGIYQRHLESFTEKEITGNAHEQARCLNCHSFCNYSPKNFLFHQRGPGGTTVLVRDGKPARLDLEQLPPGMKGTYPHWHPGGRFIAFSNNNTVQAFYAHSQDKVEVYDIASDLMIYDTQRRQVLTDKRFTDSLHWETFPAFSPKGDYLYFCQARPTLMPVHYDSLKYALLRVPFDAATGQLGEPVDTLYNPATEGGSASFPRLSPDGRYVLFTEAACGTFPIWHKEADLRMIDVQTGQPEDTTPLNSHDTESYHSWSSNGRWVLFSSRRIDGRYTRLFLAYRDRQGRFGKPFLLPQKSPKENTLRLTSYNIPEFIQDEVQLTQAQIESLFSH